MHTAPETSAVRPWVRGLPARRSPRSAQAHSVSRTPRKPRTTRLAVDFANLAEMYNTLHSGAPGGMTAAHHLLRPAPTS